eukprot:snap_masked-scaffold_46-processed-gene-1.83-mRNA-1 protein AED:1.00 eAED:1.00 QI:0/0/0/0/1/1/2/0/73
MSPIKFIGLRVLYVEDGDITVWDETVYWDSEVSSRESFEHYDELKLDIEKVRKVDYKLLNGSYFKLKLPRNVS